MDVSQTKSWGVKVPRPPTPSEGAAQTYIRIGQPESQKQLVYKNGTTLTFGPDDMVDEFEKHHPFQEQVALIDSTVSDLLQLHNAYQHINYTNKDEDQHVWDGFRSMSIDPPVTRINKLESGIYNQVPSRFASRQNVNTVYSPMLTRVGYADEDLGDLRFATLSQEQLEIKKLALKAKEDAEHWWDDSEQEYRKKKPDVDTTTTGDGSSEQGVETPAATESSPDEDAGVETPAASDGSSNAQGRSQKPNLEVPSKNQSSSTASHATEVSQGRPQHLNRAVQSKNQVSSTASAGGHEPQAAEQKSNRTRGYRRGFNQARKKFSNNGDDKQNKYHHPHAVQNGQQFNQNGPGPQGYTVEQQQAMLAATNEMLGGQPFGNMMSLAAGPGQPYGYMTPYGLYPGQLPISAVAVPPEVMHQLGYIWYPNNPSDLQAAHNALLDMQPIAQMQHMPPTLPIQHMQPLPPTLPIQHMQPIQAMQPTQPMKSMQEQIPRDAAQMQSSQNTGRASAASQKSGGLGISQVQGSMRAVHANLHPGTTPDSATTQKSGPGKPSSQHLAKPVHADFHPDLLRGYGALHDVGGLEDLRGQHHTTPADGDIDPNLTRDLSAIYESVDLEDLRSQYIAKSAQPGILPTITRGNGATHESRGLGNVQSQAPMQPARRRPETTGNPLTTHESRGFGYVQFQAPIQPARRRPETTGNSLTTHESRGFGNVLTQGPMQPIHARIRPDATRGSVATQNAGGPGNIPTQGPMQQPMQDGFHLDLTRLFAGTSRSANSRPSTASTTPVSHLSAPQPIDASLRLQQFALDQSDYEQLDREYETWADEENPFSARHREAQRHRDYMARREDLPLGPQIQSFFEENRAINPSHQRNSIWNQEPAPHRPLSQGPQPRGHGLDDQYLGYSVFGQPPGVATREPSPAVPPNRGRRLYESRRSTPGAQRMASFDSRMASFGSRLSSPGPQGGANHMGGQWSIEESSNGEGVRK